MHVRFWGTRGSIAKPGPSTLRFGGNTSCVEVRADDGTLIVLDCGTGAHGLGAELMRQGGRVDGHLLIGHTHWDHIQGFPFFEPLFQAGNRWHVYAPGGRGRELEQTLAGQMAYVYSPIDLRALEARVEFHDLTEGVLQLGSVRVRTQYLNHPALTLGYRLEADGAVLVYASDHEPHSLHPLDPEPGEPPVHHEDRRHVRFLRDADLVIHDAQYVLDEFPAKAGWGHTPVERAVDYALGARARRLALYHHDPTRHDDAVQRIAEVARASLREPGLEVFAAAEGAEIELCGHASPSERRRRSALLADASSRSDRVLLVEDDAQVAEVLREALHNDGVEVQLVPDGGAALRLARRERPGLVILARGLPGGDGLDVCRALRADSDPDLAEVPVLMLTGSRLAEDDLVDAFRAGATDYLSKPVKPTLVRSRVRGWLLRTHGA